jgi:hypothetical protein
MSAVPSTSNGNLPLSPSITDSLRYIQDIDGLFSSAWPPENDINYDPNAAQSSFKNDNAPSRPESLLVMKLFAQGQLRLEINSHHTNPFPADGKTSIKLPAVDIQLLGEGLGPRNMFEVGGTLRVDPETTADLQIRIMGGPMNDETFDTLIHFDPDPSKMDLKPRKIVNGPWGPVSLPGTFVGTIVPPCSLSEAEREQILRIVESDPDQAVSRQSSTAVLPVLPEPDSDSDDDHSMAPTYADTVTTEATSVS